MNSPVDSAIETHDPRKTRFRHDLAGVEAPSLPLAAKPTIERARGGDKITRKIEGPARAPPSLQPGGGL
jgi:hypothetical protein